MVKKTVLLLVIALIAAGAVVMSYGADMVIDGIGLLVMLIGCAIGIVRIIKRKNKDKEAKKTWMMPLICTCLSVVFLGIAGIIHFSGSVIIALLGAVLLAVAGFIEYRRL